ncbi:hypothetical protein [Xanthomonas cannabis]|uniref:Uncharacterized protein n=1 Tax=Xanthomonas cannabis TaxID=1885674 RepID=A0ABR6JPV8_9XANT|nr:hypothetical protein [Xanthomonas cannabis]MBB4594860.1 hypothetical protein [Xanthomonas cannabis]MBB5523676.1 hypothetical protein [Xanthomonas cannabis]MBZ2621164.1 hypothetical protein [Xanthomonas perforans]
MRELTNEELFLVAGAAAAADVDPSEPPTLPPVVVNPPPSGPPTLPPSPPIEFPTPPPSGGGGGGLPNPTDKNTTTDLGAEVDILVNKSATLEGLVQLAQAKGFNIVATDGYSHTDPLATGGGTVYVKMYSNPSDTASQLTHELGHTLFDGEWNTVTDRASAINMGLATEGEATIYSIAVQRELTAQGVAFNIAADPANVASYNATYDAYQAGQINWDAASAQIGESFRNGEHIDVNGTPDNKADDISYEQYYGNYWDSRKPAGG